MTSSCVRCAGRGLIEITGGTHQLSHYERGELVTIQVEATPERPVYRRCSCRDDREVAPAAPANRRFE